jgi:cell division protease FtsH
MFGGERPFSEETAREIDAEVKRIISESHEEAERLLIQHRKQLDALAQALVAKETLGEEEILKVTGLPRAPPLGTGMLAANAGNGGDPDAAH